MSGTLKAWDAINGAMGTVYADIKDSYGNEVREVMLYVKNIDAKIEKEKSEIKVLGQTGMKHKANGWKGTGSMNLYYATSVFRKMMVDYVKTGKDQYFELYIENKDPSSEIGRQSIVLKGVNIDSVSISKVDIDSTELDEDIDFTFNDVEIMKEFDPVVGE